MNISMPFSNDPNMFREIILDHYQYPRNKRKPDSDDYLSIHMDSASCIDDFYIYLKVDNGIISDALFDGIGCAISTASISIMTVLVKDKKIEEALKIIENYRHMINHDHDYDEDLLDEANAFCMTYKQANRIKCATIGWDGLEQLLTKKEQKNG